MDKLFKEKIKHQMKLFFSLCFVYTFFICVHIYAISFEEGKSCVRMCEVFSLFSFFFLFAHFQMQKTASTTPRNIVLPPRRGEVAICGRVEFSDGRRLGGEENVRSIIRELQTQLHGEMCDTSWDVLDVDIEANTFLLRGPRDSIEQVRSACALVGNFQDVRLRVDVFAVQNNTRMLPVVLPVEERDEI